MVWEAILDFLSIFRTFDATSVSELIVRAFAEKGDKFAKEKRRRVTLIHLKAATNLRKKLYLFRLSSAQFFIDIAQGTTLYLIPSYSESACLLFEDCDPQPPLQLYIFTNKQSLFLSGHINMKEFKIYNHVRKIHSNVNYKNMISCHIP